MAQYIRGSVNTTAGSFTVTGVADDNGDFPLWLSHLSPGDHIVIANDTIAYRISSVNSNTQLTLTSPYPTTRNSADYVAFTDFTPFLKLPKINNGDTQWPVMFNRAMEILDSVSMVIPNPIPSINTYELILSSANSGSYAYTVIWNSPPTNDVDLQIPNMPNNVANSTFIMSNVAAVAQTINSDLVIQGDLDVDDDVDIGGELTAGKIVNTPVKPKVISVSSPILTANDTGSVVFFSGTATMPNIATIPVGWNCVLVFGPGATAGTHNGIANFIYYGDAQGNYSFYTNAIQEYSYAGATVTVYFNGSDFIITALTGFISGV